MSNKMINKNMCKLYNADIEEYICEAYSKRTHTMKEIRNKFKISPNKIFNILKKNNVKFRGNRIDDKLSLKICEEYQKGNTVKQIHEFLNVSKSTIFKQLKKHKIKTRKYGFKRKYPLDEKIFENIDTFEKAQFLGLVYSDGSLSKYYNNISIRLREDDKEYLEEWKDKFLKTNKPLGYVAARTFVSPLSKKTYQQSLGCLILDICSKKIYNDALKIGLCPNKTKANLPMPAISDNLKKAFILGLFEADGCVTKNLKAQTQSFTIACQENMGIDVSNFLKKEGFSCSLYKRKYIYTISIMKRQDIKKLYNFLYDDSKIFLKRKKEKFKEIADSISMHNYEKSPKIEKNK